MEILQGERELLAVYHDVFKYVSMFSLGWDSGVRKVKDSTQGAKAIGKNLDMTCQILGRSAHGK